MFYFAFIPACLLSLSAPALAIVGGAPEVSDAKTQPEVMLVGSHGNFCTGTGVARDLVLTAAHCIAPDTVYKLAEIDAARHATLKDMTANRTPPAIQTQDHLAGHSARASALRRANTSRFVRQQDLDWHEARLIADGFDAEAFLWRQKGLKEFDT